VEKVKELEARPVIREIVEVPVKVREGTESISVVSSKHNEGDAKKAGVHRQVEAPRSHAVVSNKPQIATEANRANAESDFLIQSPETTGRASETSSIPSSETKNTQILREEENRFPTLETQEANRYSVNKTTSETNISQTLQQEENRFPTLETSTAKVEDESSANDTWSKPLPKKKPKGARDSIVTSQAPKAKTGKGRPVQEQVTDMSKSEIIKPDLSESVDVDLTKSQFMKDFPVQEPKEEETLTTSVYIKDKKEVDALKKTLNEYEGKLNMSMKQS
jgi:hypothetical protein